MPISVRLAPQLEERLSRASRRLRVNKTEVIKRSLESYLAEIEPGKTPLELGLDLFGADDGPRETHSVTYKSKLKKRLRAKYRR